MRIIFLILCCSLLPLPAYSQGKTIATVTKNVSKTSKTLGSINRKLPQQTRVVSKVLTNRAATTNTQALKMQTLITTPSIRVPGDITRGPVNTVNLSTPQDLKLVQQTHPDAPYLQGTGKLVEANITNYLAAEHNRRYSSFAQSIMDRTPRVPQIMQQLKEQTGELVPPENAVSWLAQQIPADTHTLLIGQGFYHNPSTVDAIASFLPELRKKMPNREIILLTDFLEKDVIWTDQLDVTDIADYRCGYEPVWKNAQNNGIKVIGMKDLTFQGYDISFIGTDDTGAPAFRFLKNSFEVLDLAGKEMQQQLKIIQEQHPDALVILHVNQWQASYNLPFSLANKIARTEAQLYVTQITSKTTLQLYHPFPGEEEERLSFRTTLFEQMYAEAQLPDEGVVTRDLAKDVGSDAWIKISFNENKIDAGEY